MVTENIKCRVTETLMRYSWACQIGWQFLMKLNEHLWPGYSIPAAAAAKSLQSCPTLCDPIDGSSPGSPVPGILQARTLEWVVISFSNAWKWKVKVKVLSRVQLFTTPWTAAYQAPPSMRLSRQDYWSGLPLPSPDIWLVGINYNVCRSVGLLCNTGIINSIFLGFIQNF